MRTILAMIGSVGLVLALLLQSASASAVEQVKAVDQAKATAPTVAELKTRMKTLTTEALKVGDLWTAIQADAYASQKLGVRSSGVLGASTIIGNPLFAFPHQINAYWDRDERLIVVSGSRVYQLSPDGYPLGVSIQTLVTPTYSSLSRDGRFLALIERVTAPQYAFKISVLDLSDGREAWNARIALDRGDSLYGGIQISSEGHALAFIIYDSTETIARMQVVRSSGKHVSVPGYYRVAAIGAEGVWGIAEPIANRAVGTVSWTILSAGKTTEVSRAVGYNGMAAVISAGPEYHLKGVTAEGTIVEMAQPMVFTTASRLYTTGEWLIAVSGKSPVTVPAGEPEVDLLGNPIVETKQPYTLACYRWADLATPAQAKPVHVILGNGAVSQITPGVIYYWKSGKVYVLDLNAATVAPKEFSNLGVLEDYDLDHGRVVMEYAEGRKQIIKEDGTELWSGVGQKVILLDAWRAIVHDDKGACALVHLAVDAAQRKRLPLDVPDATYIVFEYDRYGRRLVVSRSARSWIEYDPQTGKRMATHEGERAKPIVPTWGFPYGRFSIQAARLVERDAPPPTDPSQQWNPMDAWQIGNSMMVLDHHGQIHITGKKRGTYQTIGSIDHGDHFGVAGDDLGVANEVGAAVAAFAPGPTIVQVRPGGPALDEMPEGPWRIKSPFYIPPRSAPLIFDPTKCGFTPRLLRSPPGSAFMLMVTDSVIIETDANLGKALGILDKQGLRDL
jgi:hypothetical protein